jgi:hypothetical protein
MGESMPVVQLTESRSQNIIIHYVPTGTDLVTKAEKFWNDPKLRELAKQYDITIDAVIKSKVRALQH